MAGELRRQQREADEAGEVQNRSIMSVREVECHIEPTRDIHVEQRRVQLKALGEEEGGGTKAEVTIVTPMVAGKKGESGNKSSKKYKASEEELNDMKKALVVASEKWTARK